MKDTFTHTDKCYEALKLHCEQLESQLRERDAACAAMRELTLQIAALAWSNDTPNLFEMQCRKAIVRICKGSSQAAGSCSPLPNLHKQHSQEKETGPGPEATKVGVACRQALPGETQGEGKTEGSQIQEESPLVQNQESIKGKSSQRSALCGCDWEDKETQSLSEVRQEITDPRAPFGLHSTVECGVDVLNLSWADAQNLISTDAGRDLLERLQTAESALAPIKAELTEWQTAFAMFNRTPKELAEWAVRDAARLQAVEKKLEQAVSLLSSTDEDAVIKFLESYENKAME